MNFISLLQLILLPENFDGQRILVAGLCSLEFEGTAMWFSKADLEYYITKNAVWLDVKLTPEILKHDRKYMFVEGTFNRNKMGHMSLFSGSIENISRIEPKVSTKKTANPERSNS